MVRTANETARKQGTNPMNRAMAWNLHLERAPRKHTHKVSLACRRCPTPRTRQSAAEGAQRAGRPGCLQTTETVFGENMRTAAKTWRTYHGLALALCALAPALS